MLLTQRNENNDQNSNNKENGSKNLTTKERTIVTRSDVGRGGSGRNRTTKKPRRRIKRAARCRRYDEIVRNRCSRQTERISVRFVILLLVLLLLLLLPTTFAHEHETIIYCPTIATTTANASTILIKAVRRLFKVVIAVRVDLEQLQQSSVI